MTEPATTASETLTTEGLALNVEVVIIDHHDDALPLAADIAKRAMVDAGVPVVGLASLTSFDGTYHVDVPQAWYDDLAESGEDFWVEIGNVIVTITIP